jgi:hypothetical protein
LKYSTLIKCPFIVGSCCLCSRHGEKHLSHSSDASVAGCKRGVRCARCDMGLARRDEARIFLLYSHRTCNVCIWHSTIASIENKWMCRYAVPATNAPRLFFLCAGTFKVINDIFGRTIKRRIIYFSVSPYSQCLWCSTWKTFFSWRVLLHHERIKREQKIL